MIHATVVLFQTRQQILLSTREDDFLNKHQTRIRQSVNDLRHIATVSIVIDSSASGIPSDDFPSGSLGIKASFRLL